MLKFFLLLPLSVFCMSLRVQYLGAGIIIAFISASLCRFGFREQLTDLKPAAVYGALMYALSVFSKITTVAEAQPVPAFTGSIFTPGSEYLRLSLRLIIVIQLSALFFRSTSPLEIRNSLRHIERIISKLNRTGKRRYGYIANSIALFLCFIPEIFISWTDINYAWKARGGKNGIKKIKTILFVLISISLEKASLKERAMTARRG
jgi:biotin transport system permease protein/energy-coupling factor transport system permease protein